VRITAWEGELGAEERGEGRGPLRRAPGSEAMRAMANTQEDRGPSVPPTVRSGDGSLTLGWLMILAGGLVVVYWLLFFLEPGLVRLSEEPRYLTFELSCLLPDAVMAVVFVLGGGLRILKSRLAHAVSIMAGAFMVYLALLDVNFNLQFGTYTNFGGPQAIEALVNLACLAFGAFVALHSSFECVEAMESSRPPQVEAPVDKAEILERIKKAYGSTYLTLLSIVQGGLFAIWLNKFDEHIDDFQALLDGVPSERAPSLLLLARMLMMLLVVAGVWHDYFMGCTTYRAVLVFADALFPMALGVAQYLCIANACSTKDEWYFAFVSFWVIGAAAYVHKWRRVRRFNENLVLLRGLKPLFAWNTGICVVYAAVFALMPVFRRTASDKVLTVIIALALIGYVAKAAYLWKRTLTVLGAENTSVV